MKIKTQLNLLIIAIVAMPLITMICLPVYHYFTSPQRYLMRDYENLRRVNSIEMSDSEWEMLKDRLENLPHNFQTLVYYDNTVLISNFPDLKTGTKLSFGELYEYISETSSSYDYQLQSHLGNRTTIRDPSLRRSRVMVLNRAKNTIQADKTPLKSFYIPFFIGVTFFELFIILFIIRVSNNITKSILYLEKGCKRIAEGELDTVIDKPSKEKQTNEITSLSENLDKLRVSIKDAYLRRTKFVMGVSHDLRTPVAIIKGYSEAITDGIMTDPEQIRNSAAIIETKADQLESMINELIDYSKMYNSDWLRHLQEQNVLPLITELFNDAEVTAQVYKRKVEIVNELDTPVNVKMDRALVSRAFSNILQNAFRYSNDDDTITITARKTDCLEVSIKDTGIGMTEEDKNQMYDIFYRGSSSRREAGMGIGLSVVKTIVDIHNWNIEVESEPNKGTTFTVKIPC